MRLDFTLVLLILKFHDSLCRGLAIFQDDLRHDSATF